MAAQQTLSIIKPNAVQKPRTGTVPACPEQSGPETVATKMLRSGRENAARFCDVHRERPFFAGLVEPVTPGAVMVRMTRGKNAARKTVFFLAGREFCR